MRSAILALAIVAVLLAPLANAQVPPIPAPSPAGVSIRAQSSELTLSLDTPGSVQLQVTNTGSKTGTPLDQARQFAVSVSPAPEGWLASVEPASFQLGPGASQTVTLTVSVSGSATEGVAHLNVTARLYPSGVSGVPVAGSQIDPEATSSAAVTATRQDSALRQAVEKAGPYLWILLLGLAAVVVILVSLVVANRRVAVRLSSPEAAVTLPPGGRVPFVVVVKNITRRDDTVVLRTSPMPAGWATFVPTAQLDMEPGAEEEVSVIVIAPRDAKAGDHVAISLVATSAQAPRRPASLKFEATVAEPSGAKPRKSRPGKEA